MSAFEPIADIEFHRQVRAMQLEPALHTIEAAAVLAGVIFGLIQLRQLRTQRDTQTSIELLHPLQARDFAEAVLLVHSLPDNLDERGLREQLGDKFGTVLALLAVFESLGPLIARGYIPLATYAEFYRGPTLLCWTKLHRYIDERRRSDWPMLFEWLQWLAEQLQRRGSTAHELPAYQRFREWRYAGDYKRLSRRLR